MLNIPNAQYFEAIIQGSLLLVAEIVSIATLIFCHTFFSSRKDNYTDAIWREIRLYPLIFLSINSIFVVITFMNALSIPIPPRLVIVQHIGLGSQGTLTCLVFFWKRHKNKVRRTLGEDNLAKVTPKIADDFKVVV